MFALRMHQHWARTSVCKHSMCVLCVCMCCVCMCVCVACTSGTHNANIIIRSRSHVTYIGMHPVDPGIGSTHAASEKLEWHHVTPIGTRLSTTTGLTPPTKLERHYSPMRIHPPGQTGKVPPNAMSFSHKIGIAIPTDAIASLPQIGIATVAHLV